MFALSIYPHELLANTQVVAIEVELIISWLMRQLVPRNCKAVPLTTLSVYHIFPLIPKGLVVDDNLMLFLFIRIYKFCYHSWLVLYFAKFLRWLANRGRLEESFDIIVAAKGNREDAQVKLQLEEMKEQVMIDRKAVDFSYRRQFRKKTIRKTIISVSAEIWQHLCGMNVMMYFMVYNFKMAGYSGSTVLVSGSIQYVLNVVMTIPALFLVDKVGHRLVPIT